MSTDSPAPARTARVARTRPPRPVPVRLYRDDGPLCRGLGVLARGLLPPLPGALVALAATLVLVTVGIGREHTVTLFAPVVVLLLTGPAATHPHNGRLDWLVPPIVRAIEYGYLAVLGFAQNVPAGFIFLLIAVLAYHHYDIVYRVRQGRPPEDWVFRAGLGWEGRMLLVALAGLGGLLEFAYPALAVYLGVLFAGESVRTWMPAGHGSGVQIRPEE